MNRIAVATSFAAAFGILYAAVPAQALTMKECSAKYQDAKNAGTLNGLKWNDFRKAQCGGDAPPDAAAAAPAQATPPAAKPATTAAKPIAPATANGAVFPASVSAKYASESAGKARMHTCLDQYNANKTAGASGNGGMNWIEKGGGYYSQCNKRLKGV